MKYTFLITFPEAAARLYRIPESVSVFVITKVCPDEVLAPKVIHTAQLIVCYTEPMVLKGLFVTDRVPPSQVYTPMGLDVLYRKMQIPSSELTRLN